MGLLHQMRVLLGHRSGGKHHIPGAGPSERGLEDPQEKGTGPKHKISRRKFQVSLSNIQCMPTISFELYRSVNTCFRFSKLCDLGYNS